MNFFKKRVLTKVIIFAALVLLCAVIGFTAPFTVSAQPASADVDDNYRFDRVSVDITVNKDKTFNICETLDVNFIQSNVNTGIIRDIQRVSKTTRIIDGKHKNGGSYLGGLSGVSVTLDGAPAKVTQSFYNNGDFYSIKMQQPSGYIQAGVHTFVLNYVYDMHDDKISGVDDFTLDVLGYAMAFTSEFNAKITFPEGTDLSEVSIRTNEKRQWTPNGDFGEYARTEGNSVLIKAHPQSANVGYTVQVLLPDGYFTVHKTFYWYYVIFAVIAFAAVAAVVIITATSIKRKPLRTVEFYPPEGMSVMRFASIWRMGAKTKDAAALILKWVGMGAIKLTHDGRRNVILSAQLLCDEISAKLPPSLRLAKQPYGESYFDSEAEENYFNLMFSGIGGYNFTFSTKFFKHSMNAGAKRAFYRASEALQTEGDDKPTPAVKSNTVKRVSAMFICLVPTVAVVVYFSILNASFLPCVFLLFMVVGNVPVLGKSQMYAPILYIFPVAFYGMTYGAFFFIFGLSAYDYAYLLYIAPVIWALGVFVVRFIIRDERTSEVMSDYAKILGFRDFLLKAELPKIQVLFDDDPFYFSEILPFCLIMGISDKVEKRFAALEITLPEYLTEGVSLHIVCACLSYASTQGAPRSSGFGGGGGGGGSSGGGGGGGGSRGC